MIRLCTLALVLLLPSTLATSAAVFPCLDSCLFGETRDQASCDLWDSSRETWVMSPTDGPGHLHNRARHHNTWLHHWMMPAGGVMAAQFTDATLSEIAGYTGKRDSAIWTGTYLAAEALRYMTTGAPDANRWIEQTVQTLHRWWRISGDPGYLARYAAPADSPPEIQALLSADEAEVHRDVPFEDALWHWRGRVSRDQYQGVLLGYSLAYAATGNPAVRATIRQDVVEFVEQLMRSDSRQIKITVNGQTLNREVNIPYAVFGAADAPDGIPVLSLQTSPFVASGEGVLFYAPNVADLIRQLPGLGFFPDLPLPTHAIQLAAIFNVALQVTEGVPDYASRREAIAEHYEQHVDEWLDIATGWSNTNQCDEGYFGLNIGFIPLYNWLRLETDPARLGRLQRELLRDAMWTEVADHKNVFFAFVYAAGAPPEDEITNLVEEHAAQLALFPTAPNLALPRDLRGIYPESQECPGISAVAVNVDERVPATFTWERHPWKLFDPGTPNKVYAGVDYQLAYWMGRYYGFIDDDDPSTCLAWSCSAQ